MKNFFLLPLVFFVMFLFVACDEKASLSSEPLSITVVDTLYIDVIDTVVIDSVDSVTVERVVDVFSNDTVLLDPDCETLDEDSIVTFSCGNRTFIAYRGNCDSSAFDPSKQFCSNGVILDLCEGLSYNPNRFFCDENTLYERCNKESYDVTKYFCYEGKLYDKQKYECVDFELVPLCGGKTYFETTQFCFQDKVYELCDGQEYNPEKSFCSSEMKIVELCGGKSYDVENAFCFFGMITHTCGINKVVYDAMKSTCIDGEVKGLCGKIPYDTTGLFCYNERLHALCDGLAYNPNINGCKNDVLLVLCNGDLVEDPKKQYCQNGTAIVDKGSFIDKRDGKEYKTIVIDHQTWMAENLDYAYPMPEGSSDSSSFYYIDFGVPADEQYGRYYTWGAAADSAGYFASEESGSFVRGVCPEGWHLPSVDELNALVEFASTFGTLMETLGATTGWVQSNIGGKNYLGLNVYPAGISYGSDRAGYRGQHASFWTSMNINVDEDGYRKYVYFGLELYRSYTNGVVINTVDVDFRSVRCVKDE